MLPTASLTIADLLSGPYLLNVPVYQRPYSWGVEQADALLDDLIEAASIANDVSDDPDYFLGTILLMDTPGNRTEKLSPKMAAREFDVVDGQQRLVTLMTLFAVLRDLERDAKSATARTANAMLVAQQGARFFRTQRYRMHVTGRDRLVFENNILLADSTDQPIAANQPTASELALIKVRDSLRSTLQALPQRERRSLFDYVCDRCHVVVIVSHDIDRAHRTFVVLNERGKSLQRNDILKADVLSRLPQARLADAVRMWNEAESLLGAEFETFFSHLRSIYGHSKPQIVAGVRSIMQTVGGAEPFLSEVMLPFAKTYALVRSSGRGGLPAGIARRLHYLNRLANSDWAPAAMMALKDWQRDPDRADFLIGEIDRLAHLSRLLGCGSGKRVRKFAALIAAMRSGEVDAEHPALQLTREEQRNVAFNLRDMHTRNAKLCKLMLMRFSDEIDGVVEARDPERYTIEHVLPQRPAAKSEWRQWFPDTETRNRATDSLGNLVLISQAQNDAARNASWQAKREIYGVPPPEAPLLAVTREALANETWTPAVVAAREQRLFDIMDRIWRAGVRSTRNGPEADPANGGAPHPAAATAPAQTSPAAN